MESAVIVGSARTPMGAFLGALSSLSAPELGAVAVSAALHRSGVKADQVGQLLMGCVLPAGQGQAPARQAAFKAGLDNATAATTVNKMCGSGMEALMIASDRIRAGACEIAVAGGMESMSNAPYLLPRMRAGARMGHAAAIDHMFFDGLEDAYEPGRLMGSFAEDCATEYQFSRQAQDSFALRSLDAALAAQQSGIFATEIATVTVKSRAGQTTIEVDEQLGSALPEKIPSLKPAFRADGTVTAANSSSISDGAAAIVLCSGAAAAIQGLPVRARIVGGAAHAQEPARFTTAPVYAVQKLLSRIGWSSESVDLWEVNEAFAVVPMAFLRETGIDQDRLNVHGGACALGHPIGASGARIVVTLLNALEQRKLRRGVAAVCIGGGEATAIAIEVV